MAKESAKQRATVAAPNKVLSNTVSGMTEDAKRVAEHAAGGLPEGAEKLKAVDVLKEHKTKSAAIRHLHAQGWSRAQIANFLGIRYQHVRTVLITPLAAET